MTKHYTFDATGKKPGRLATEIAAILLGKQSVTFAKNTIADVTVEVTNASQLDISDKRSAELFQTYSGFPGGRRTETWKHLGARRGYAEVFRRIVDGMIPRNKLRAPRMKLITITD